MSPTKNVENWTFVSSEDRGADFEHLETLYHQLNTLMQQNPGIGYKETSLDGNDKNRLLALINEQRASAKLPALTLETFPDAYKTLF